MCKTTFTIRIALLLAFVLGLSLMQVANSQTIKSNQSATTYVQSTTTTAAPTSMDAEKEQIWNSPDMLRARAWLKDYCSKSAKVTPEMAKEYEAELANMTAKQMKIYLMKFDEEEQQRQQQYAMFQQANQAGLQHAMAVQRQTRQNYAAMNQGETAAAQNAQQQINEQREAAQQAAEDKRLEQSTYPYGTGYGYGPYGFSPYAPYGYGGVHYHYHLYGN
jgi:hypothetical protein